MKIADLRRLLEDSKVKDGVIQMDFEKGYNMGMRHALMYLELYEKWQEPEEKGVEGEEVGNDDTFGDINSTVRTCNLQRALRDMVQPQNDEYR